MRRAAVLHAARAARRFVYDPNYRPRLTTAAAAAETLTELAPHGWLVTPSFPGETAALLDVDTAVEAGRRLRHLGAQNVAVTCGATGVQLVDRGREAWITAIPAPAVVDQTGAGDAYVGTLTARLVLGDDLVLRRPTGRGRLVAGRRRPRRHRPRPHPRRRPGTPGCRVEEHRRDDVSLLDLSPVIPVVTIDDPAHAAPRRPRAARRRDRDHRVDPAHRASARGADGRSPRRCRRSPSAPARC